MASAPLQLLTQDQDKNLTTNIVGTVCAVSHSFRAEDEYRAFLRMDIEGETKYVLVKEEKLQEWAQQIKEYETYRLKRLRDGFIRLPSGDLKNIYETTSTSTLERLKEKRLSGPMRLKENEEEKKANLVSGKFKVQAILDGEVGVYLMNEKDLLYTAFLKGITGELPAEECSAGSAAAPSFIVAPGDTLRLFKCHYLTLPDRNLLIACGQSHIINKRRPFPLKTTPATVSTITDSINSLNINYNGFRWLYYIKEKLKTILEDYCGGSDWPDMLRTLLSEASKRGLITQRPRSLTAEFLQPQGRCDCGLLADFAPPFDLVSISSENNELEAMVKESERQKLQVPTQKFQPYWRYISVDGRNVEGSQCVLVGELKFSPGGMLVLQQKSGSVSIAIVGNAGLAGFTCGSIVALLGWQVIKETFLNDQKEEIEKLYVAAKESDIIILNNGLPRQSLIVPSSESSAAAAGASSSSAADQVISPNRFRLTLLSKTAMIFNFKGMQPNEISLLNLPNVMSFWGKVSFEKVGPEREVMEKWDRFVKFPSSSRSLYPFLEVGDECELAIPPSINPEVSLKGREMYGQCGMMSMDLPEQINITKETTRNIGHGELSVNGARCGGVGLFNVRGIMRHKHFTKSNFASEGQIKSDVVIGENIGVPHGYTFNITLEDESDPDCHIVLYTSCSKNLLTRSYPLYIIPGVTILVTDVTRTVARFSRNVYLKDTKTTRVVPVTTPSPRSQPPLDLRSATASTFPPFVTFASVTEVLEANVRVVCIECDTVQEKENTNCPSCKGTSRDVRVAMTLAIDDGTDSAVVYVEGIKALATLLGLNRDEYKQLRDILISQCVNSDCDEPDPQDEFLHIYLRKILSGAGCGGHSFKFRLKKELPYFKCLEVLPVRPLVDVKIFEA